MDIKPFIQPEINVWVDLGPTWIIMLGIGALVFVASFIIINKKGANVLTLGLFMLGIFGLLMSAAFGAEASRDARVAAYESHVSVLKDNLADDGFKVISGTPNLKPNTQSSMLLSYEGKNFDCTLFTPEDVNTSVVFSCGEAKLNLEEIKNTDPK